MGQNTHRFSTQVVCTQEKFIPSKKLKASRATISGFPVHRVGEAGNKSAIYSFSSHVVYVAPSFPFPVLLGAGS